jgi:hypothetical protein
MSATASCVRASGAWISVRRAAPDRRLGFPADRAVRVSSTRLMSFVKRPIAAICYDVEPLDGSVWIVAQSELVANGQLPVPDGDPLAAAVEPCTVLKQGLRRGCGATSPRRMTGSRKRSALVRRE